MVLTGWLVLADVGLWFVFCYFVLLMGGLVGVLGGVPAFYEFRLEGCCWNLAQWECR